MKKGIVLLGLFVFLSVTIAASLMLSAADMNAQVQQKVLQQRKALIVLKPSVTSVTPQKAVLTQGGDPVVVQANGANLGVINSAQVLRAGNAVTEIEVTLDKSLPGTLKVSLKATPTAPIANDYQLAVFDADNKKLLDVPNKVLSIEVVAPVKKAVIAQKTTTTIKTTEPVQRQVQTKAITSAVKPGVASVSPQKAVLSRGGEPVVVEAKGTDLTAVGSVQVTRAGSEAQGIEETLDKSQLPNTLKVSLKASSEAPAANDYQLSVFDANKKKLIDVPTSVLAIEVVAQGAKVFAAPITQKPRQQAPLSRDQMVVSRPDVASISPQKAVLIQGGDPVVVVAKGAKLDMVASARVMRAGAPVPEIEATVDRSQLPTSFKVNLKASSQAQVGTGYQLAVFDTNRRKILDVPSSALAIEVAASAQTSNTDSGLPDLIITEISQDPLNPMEKQSWRFKVVIKNQGNAPAVFAKGIKYLANYNRGSWNGTTWNSTITIAPGNSFVGSNYVGPYTAGNYNSLSI